MKWYVYLICFILVIAGAFCGVRLYTLVTAESYINGSINIENKFRSDSFVYANTQVNFYQNDLYNNPDLYGYTIDLLRVDDFNGAKKTYETTLNGYLLFNVTYTAGSAYTDVYMDFYDTDGNVLNKAVLKITVLFLSNKTTLTLSTTGNNNASYLSQYFADYGIRLKITELTMAKV